MKKLSKTSFAFLPPGRMLERANIIVSNMEANVATFATPTPTLVEVQAAINALEAAMALAATGDKHAIATKNEKAAALAALLANLGLYVDMVAAGRRSIASLSGFLLVKEPQRSAPILSVPPPVVKPGPNVAELEARIRAVRGAKAYLFCISPNDQLPLVQWESYPATISRYRFTGLQSAKRYFISVAAVGINNQVVYSNVVSFVTQ